MARERALRGNASLAGVRIEAAAGALGAHAHGVRVEAGATLLVGEGTGDILAGLAAIERDPLLRRGLDDDAQGRIEALDEVVLGRLVVGVGLVGEGAIEPVLGLLVLANDGAALGGSRAARGIRTLRGDAADGDGDAAIPADGGDPVAVGRTGDPELAVLPDEGVVDADGPAVLGAPHDDALSGVVHELVDLLVAEGVDGNDLVVAHSFGHRGTSLRSGAYGSQPGASPQRVSARARRSPGAACR